MQLLSCKSSKLCGEVPKGRLLQIQSSRSTKGNFKFGGLNEQFGILGGKMNSKFPGKLV